MHSRVVPDVTAKNFMPAIEQVMEPKRTWLYTDEHSGYRSLAPQMAGREAVNHSAGEYTRGNVSTNLVENYSSQLMRCLDGTHHHVSTEHLPRYLSEFDFHASTHFINDSQRMRRLMGQPVAADSATSRSPARTSDLLWTSPRAEWREGRAVPSPGLAELGLRDRLSRFDDHWVRLGRSSRFPPGSK